MHQVEKKLRLYYDARSVNHQDFPNMVIAFLYMCSFLTGAQESHLQRVTIPEAAYIQLLRGPPEDEQGNARNM